MKNNLNKFGQYIDDAINDCKKLSFAEKTEGLWSEPAIIEYFSKTPADEPMIFLAASLKEILPNLSEKKIICIGGGTGKLGRLIASLYPGIQVTEIDSSLQMVSQANKLASEQNLNNYVRSINADAKQLPFQNNEYDYGLAYGIIRYMDTDEQSKIISEIGRITNYNFTIAEVILKELIHSLQDKLPGNISWELKETRVTMPRTTLFYMLFKRYKRDSYFKTMVDQEITHAMTALDVLINIAGTANGMLYELRAGNTNKY